MVCGWYSWTKKYCGIWNSIIAYRYLTGIQKSLQKFETKNYGMQSAIQKFWYMSNIQAKKRCMKLYTKLFFLPWCVQDLQSNLLDLHIFNFCVNPGISRVGIDAVTYRMDIKRSWNVPLIIWFDSGSSGNLKIISILARLMIALTFLYHANSNKTINIQSDHQYWCWQKISHHDMVIQNSGHCGHWLFSI